MKNISKWSRIFSLNSMSFIFLSAVLYWLSFSMVRPTMALFFDDQGFSSLTVGLFMALNSIIPIVFAMPVGSWIDKMGARRAVTVGSFLSLISGGAYLIGGGSYSNISIVLCGQLISGVGGMFSWGALQAAASLSATAQQGSGKGNRMISSFTFYNSIAQLAGPAAGGFFSELGGFQLVFWIFTAISLMGMLLALKIPAPNEGSVTYTSGKAETWKQAFMQSYGSGYLLLRKNKVFSVAILLNGVLFMLVDLRTTFLPLYFSNIGLTYSEIGTILSISALAALLIRPCTSYLMDALGHHRIMLISIFSGAVCLLLLTLEPDFWLIAGIIFIWGACTGINQPMGLIMVSQAVQPEEQGMGMSIRTMSNRIVQLTNPVLFGTLSTVIGLSFGFGVMGVLLLGIGFVYRRQRRAYAYNKSLKM
ncbi:MFS transporter [Paenibacillus sp.]|uniref:MFS transporter n=1 Tax=Paenibacillus TaxID=44249 RepID=UPI0035628B21